MTIEDTDVMLLIGPIYRDEEPRSRGLLIHDPTPSLQWRASKAVVRVTSGGVVFESLAKPHLSDPFGAQRARRSKVRKRRSKEGKRSHPYRRAGCRPPRP